MPRLRTTYALLACAAVGLAGCAKTLDTADAEGKIEDEVKKQGGSGEVECPDDMEAKKGKRYQCTLKGPGGAQRSVTIEMTDDDGGFRFEVEAPKQ